MRRVSDATSEGKDRAKGGFATTSESDNLAANAILLSCKGQSSKGYTRKVGNRDRCGIVSLCPDPQLNILEVEWSCVGGSAGAFSRTQEIEKGKSNHVSDGLIAFVLGGVGNSQNMTQDLDGNRFDTIWRRIFFLVSGDLSKETEVGFAEGV